MKRDPSLKLMVRPGQLSDYPHIVLYDEFPGDRRLDLQAARIWIADTPGETSAGYACIDPTDFLGWPLLSRLCVKPGARRFGVAETLIRGLLSDSIYLRLYTSTEQSNQPMRTLLAKVGAQEIGYTDELNFSAERECLYRLK